MSDFYYYEQEKTNQEAGYEQVNKTEKQSKKKRKKGDFLKLTAYATLFGMLGGVSFYGVTQVANHFGGSNVQNESSVIAGSDNSSGILQTSVVTAGAISTASENSGVSNVASSVLPSIVQIQVTALTQGYGYFGQSSQQESSGSGSGIIIGTNKTEVLIATNNHVVANANKVVIQFADGEKVQATVKGKDSISDLAVVSVKLTDLKSSTKSKIKVATLGDSKTLKVGEQAIAVGNALGYGTSVTVGYISAKDREISMEDGNMKVLQTDAAINPGNSGGALVNSKGEVIGINSAKFASEGVEGMGFAIPISDAIPIINDLMKKETISQADQAYLGIKGVDVSDEYHDYYGIPIGIYISEVTKDSPAFRAGLEKGQVITEINGRKVTTTKTLSELLTGIKAGTKGTITVQEQVSGNYKKKEISVTFGSKPETSSDSSTNRSTNN